MPAIGSVRQGQQSPLASMRSRQRWGSWGIFLVLSAALFAVVGVFSAAAEAKPKAILGSFGTPNGSDGGQLLFSRGVAANQTGAGGAPVGSVYVAEGNTNHRISQYTADGDFIRTWGYGVIEPEKANDNGAGFEICDVTDGNSSADCQAGAAGPAAGQLNNPIGIAIDQTTGYLFVASVGNRRVDVFGPKGEFAGAFGWGVDTGAAALEVCTTGSGCQAAAAAGAAAGNFSSLNGSGPAINLTGAPGSIYVPDVGNARVAEYNTTVDTVTGTLTAVSFTRAFGWDVDPTGGTGLEVCTAECKAGTSGNGAGQFGPLNTGSPTAAAVDSTGSIYVASGPLLGAGAAGTCSATTPCRVQKFSPDATSASNFGPESGAGQLTHTSGASNTVAALALAVDPSNDHLFVLRKESTSTYRVLEYDSGGAYLETHPAASTPALTGATTSTGPGLAIGSQGRVYANLGAAAVGSSQVFILGDVPPPEVEMTSVEDVTSSSALFKGVVTVPAPGGPGFEASWHFEYSSDGANWTQAPAIDLVTGSAAEPYDVEAEATGLAPNTSYQVRLVASTGEEVASEPLFFKTLPALPSVPLTFTEDVNQTEATLGAHVNPGGLKSSYYFEWGPTTAYGNRVPVEFDRPLGAGTETLIVKEKLSGLSPRSSYHFRVVVENSLGSVNGPDQRFETLNQCGLANNRCFELVSPSDKGPVAGAGDTVSQGTELRFQAMFDGTGIVYAIANGLPDATIGGEVLYRGTRDEGGWSAEQLSPPALGPNNTTGGGSIPLFTRLLSKDLSCGFVSSYLPLASDTPKAVTDAGHANLFRLNEDGSYTLVTSEVPSNLETIFALPLLEYQVVGASEDCSKVVFGTEFEYPGAAGAGSIRFYEWQEGALRYLGIVPTSSGDEPVPATAGSFTGENAWRAISADGKRVSFTADRQTSSLPAEVGQRAIFVRKDGTETVDASRSRTGVPSAGAVYQTASTDGRYVFFTANYGLTPQSSTGAAACSATTGTGCDLYRYDVDTDTLLDLSADSNPADTQGAGVVGVLSASDDGSNVYFAARGQLVAGQGNTAAANLSANSYNVYRATPDSIQYAGKVRQADLDTGATGALLSTSTVESGSDWTSRVTPDGKHLIYGSTANVIGYDSGGAVEIYRFSSETGAIDCVSCRRDGKPSVASSTASPIDSGDSVANLLHPPLRISDDGRRVYFSKFDPLAWGAIEGQENLYQWEEGQISLLATREPGVFLGLQFAGANATADDVYIATSQQLNWEDVDGRTDVYDARVDGGFSQPPPAPDPCQALTEGSCQGAPSAVVPPASAPATSNHSGPGNVTSSPQKSKPKKKRAKKRGAKNRGKKKGRNAKQKKGSRSASRAANNDRRAGK